MRRPAWWFWPVRCENGHEWGPHRVLVSFTRCHCPPLQAACGGDGRNGPLDGVLPGAGVLVGLVHAAASACCGRRSRRP